MKRTVLLLMIILFFPMTVQGEIPFGVSATEVVIYGSVDLDSGGSYAKINGLPGNYATGETFDGKWDSIKLDSMDYTIRFWNVGELGEGSYADATLQLSYTVADNGIIWRRSGSYDTYTFEPAPDPNFNTITYTLKFSGGPSGYFMEVAPYHNKYNKPLSGRIDAGSIILSKPSVTLEEYNANPLRDYNPVGMNELCSTDIIIPGNPFFSWPVDEEPCVDSNARFSSISRIVELFPHSNPDNIRSAKPQSIICVNDHVVTGEESIAVISFPDLSTLMMKEESEIIIKAPPEQTEKTILEQLGGTLKMNIKKVLSGESIEVKSNLATLGIKGTVFISTVSASEHTVKVLEGTVEFTDNRTKETVIVQEGEMVSSKATGLSNIERFDVQEESNLWPTAIADFSYTPLHPRTTDTVVFTDTSYYEDEDTIERSWDLADGTISDDINPVHSYLNPGVYTITLTISDDAGIVSSVTKTIEITSTGSQGTAGFELLLLFLALACVLSILTISRKNH